MKLNPHQRGMKAVEMHRIATGMARVTTATLRAAGVRLSTGAITGVIGAAAAMRARPNATNTVSIQMITITTPRKFMG